MQACPSLPPSAFWEALDQVPTISKKVPRSLGSHLLDAALVAD